MRSSKTIFDHEGKVILVKNFIKEDLTNQLQDEITFKSEMIKMYGKDIIVPRLVAYQGDLNYQYSNITHLAAPFTNTILALKNSIEAFTQFEFNSVLANLYKTGTDYMGYHRDNEPELDTSLIASLSCGATRKFKFKHKKTKQTIDIVLDNGDLLLMYHCQQAWEHALPKSLKVNQKRINLTFRRVIIAANSSY